MILNPSYVIICVLQQETQMLFYQETTEWASDVPNHTYLLNDSRSKMIGYVRVGTNQVHVFSKPMGFETRGRTFKRVANTFGFQPVEEKPVYPAWTVDGSGGNKYTVSLIDGKYVCSCTGFKFHGRCKHATKIQGEQK